jgi:hypothetical protein|tara:strand:+ start:4764 stop:4880 length:117 start_codon:yes stop_codon:yes gene_type:complete
MYNLPITLRRWFLERLAEEYKKEAAENKKAMDESRRKR